MPHYMIFWGLFIASTMYAMIGGGAPERAGSAILVAGVLLTAISWVPGPRHIFMWGILFADVATLAGFWTLALLSARYWPMWMAGIQLLQVGSHATFLMPKRLYMTYEIAIVTFGYALVLCLAVGTLRHRIRLKRFGPEPSWRQRAGA